MQRRLERARNWFAAFFTSAGVQACRNVASLLAATGVAQICGLVNVLLLTNSLGAEQYGVLAFALTLQSYLMILGTAGLRPIIVRELTSRPDSLNRLCSAYIAITGSLGVGLGLLTVVLALILAPTASEQAVLALVGLGNLAACVNASPFYDYRHAQSRCAVILATAEVAALLLLLGLHLTGSLTLPIAAAVFTAKWLGSCCLLWLTLRRDLPNLCWEWSPNEARRVLTPSSKLVVSALLATIPFSAGIVLVRLIHGDAAAGIFAVALYAPRALMLMVTQFNRVLQPHIMGPYGRMRDFVVRLVLSYSLFLASTGLLLAVGMWCATRWLLPPEFEPALASGLIMLAAGALIAATRVGQLYLVRSHREGVVAVTNAFIAVGFLCAGVVLVSALPIRGPAWALVFSSCVAVAVVGYSLIGARSS